MIVIEYEEFAEEVPVSDRIFSCDRAEKYFNSLFERAEDGFDQASFTERAGIRIPI